MEVHSQDMSAQLKTLEAQLESKLAMFSVLVAKVSGDVEGGGGGMTVVGGHEERALSNDIDHDLSEMNRSISMLRNSGDTSSRRDFVLRRYENIYSEYMGEYAKLSGRLRKAKETSELFQYKDSQGRNASARGDDGKKGGGDSATDKLLRERSGIANSMKGVSDALAQAYEAKDALFSQRGSLVGAQGGLSGMIRKMPTFGKLIDRVAKKRDKETLILASLIAALIVFTLWWVFMR